MYFCHLFGEVQGEMRKVCVVTKEKEILIILLD